MGIPIIGDVINAVKDLVGEVVVDKDKKNELNFRLKELEDQADARIHAEILAIQEVNKAEANHGSVFVAGWRPFVGWVGGFGLAYAAVVNPLLNWFAQVAFGYTGSFPKVDTYMLLTVLGGMLGIGTMRSLEKMKGVSTNDYRDNPGR